MVKTYNGALCDLQKEGNFDILSLALEVGMSEGLSRVKFLSRGIQECNTPTTSSPYPKLLHPQTEDIEKKKESVGNKYRLFLVSIPR